MWKTILVPHDFSPSAIRATAIACAEAKQHGGRVLLLHVVELPVHFGPDTTLIIASDRETPIGMRQYAVSRAAQYLDELVDRLLADGISATAFVRVGIPVDEINRFANEHAIDTIVMGTHGRTGIRHLLAGSVAERVVRTSEVPVLTIRHAD